MKGRPGVLKSLQWQTELIRDIKLLIRAMNINELEDYIEKTEDVQLGMIW